VPTSPATVTVASDHDNDDDTNTNTNTNTDTDNIDNDDNDDDIDIDDIDGDDIDNNNDSGDTNDIEDDIDYDVDESPGSYGNNLNDFENELEEWEDDEISPGCGHKRPRTGSAHSWRKPVKVHVTTGMKPKAGDYEIAVKKVLSEAIPRYRGYLSMSAPYPGPMEEMRWAKKSWKSGCEECLTRMAPNNEIITLVSVHANVCQHVALTIPKDYQPWLTLPWPSQN
jgi:hypothetical protein